MRPRVLILGGGFAGLSCALELPASRFAVTLVDRRGTSNFTRLFTSWFPA